MPVINKLIHYVHDMGWGQVVYDSAFPVIVIAELIYCLVYRKKYDISKKQAIAAAFILIASSQTLSPALAWVENGFQSISGANILRVFVYLPLIGLLATKILNIPAGVMLDYFAPAIVLWHLIGQAACPFLGCCAGIPWEWGIWNPFLDELVFPIQWLICLVLLGVLLLILRYEKKHDYDGSGKAYPVMLVVYGVLRFFLEFLKQGHKVFLGISGLGIHALLMAAVGTIWLFTLEEIKLENKRKAESNRKKRRTYSPQGQHRISEGG